MPHETAATVPRERQLAELALVDQPAGSASSSATKPPVIDGAAGAAVGLQHVAVDVDRALAERLEVDDAAQRAADQALDLHGAAVRAALRDVALLAVAGGGGEHPVLGGHPAAALAGHPARHRLVAPTRCRSRACSPQEISAEPVAVRTKFGLDRDRAAARRRARPPLRSRLMRASRPRRRTSRRARPRPSGSCRKRVPERGGTSSTSPVERKRVVALAAARVARGRGAPSTCSDLAAPPARRSVTISPPRPSMRWSIGRTSG